MKKVSIALIAALLLLGPMFLAPAHASLPPPYSSIKNPWSLIESTIEGGNPVTVDPAAAYDIASAQLIQHVYDTLIFYDGERINSSSPVLATQWWIQNITVTKGTGPANVAHYSRPSYYRYTFKLTPNAPWQNSAYGNVTTADVAYSFKREMIEDYAGGPQWMLDEPLLGNAAGPTAWNIGNATNPGPDAAMVGQMIDDAVQYNSTHVWFNIAYGNGTGTGGGPYPPFIQILCHTWSSILSENWIVNYVIPLGRAHPTDPIFAPYYPVIDWNGSFGAGYTQWLAAHFATTTPTDLDYGGTDAGALMMGSGPFKLYILDYAMNRWVVTRFKNYFRGWPATFPKLAGSAPAGWVDNFTVTWVDDWSTRYLMFENGDVDFIAVPRQYLSQMYQSSNPPYYPPNYPLDGIRCIEPLRELYVEGLFFQFAVNPYSPYGRYVANGTFDQNAIPYDFFGNATWGIHTRRAFAYAIDYATYIAMAYLNEAVQPATAIIPGIPYYNSSVTGYSYNITVATNEFWKVPGLMTKGFTLTLAYTLGNTAQETLVNMLQTAIQGINTKFHINVVPLQWHSYMTSMIFGLLPAFVNGWLADFADPHDFAAAFYSLRAGVYAAWQRYDDPAMDALVAQGIATPDGPARQTVYTDIQKLAVADCSFVPTDQPVGRHFECDWVVGWYFNQLYPDMYVYNLWKWYYVPQALYNPVVQPQSYWLPADVNYDGKIDMIDTGIVAAAFGSSYGPPISPKWVFRADINNDRKVNMIDVGIVANLFGKASPKWVPPP